MRVRLLKRRTEVLRLYPGPGLIPNAVIWVHGTCVAVLTICGFAWLGLGCWMLASTLPLLCLHLCWTLFSRGHCFTCPTANCTVLLYGLELALLLGTGVLGTWVGVESGTAAYCSLHPSAQICTSLTLFHKCEIAKAEAGVALHSFALIAAVILFPTLVFQGLAIVRRCGEHRKECILDRAQMEEVLRVSGYWENFPPAAASPFQPTRSFREPYVTRAVRPTALT